MPPTDGSHAGRVLADFLRSVDANQPPIKMQPPVSDMLRAVAPHAPRGLRGLLHHADVWSVRFCSRVCASDESVVTGAHVCMHVCSFSQLPDCSGRADSWRTPGWGCRE